MGWELMISFENSEVIFLIFKIIKISYWFLNKALQDIIPKRFETASIELFEITIVSCDTKQSGVKIKEIFSYSKAF